MSKIEARVLPHVRKEMFWTFVIGFFATALFYIVFPPLASMARDHVLTASVTSLPHGD